MARPERTSIRHFDNERASRLRLAPIDFFALLNLALFALMCVFTYYARFIQYRGAANVWEFFVYATVLVAGIVLLWRFFRGYALPVALLTLIQLGIVAHFAGAFVHWGHVRLYDLVFAGIRYDKVVHFTNAFVAVRVARHIAERHGMKIDGLTRLFLALSVLGLGAIVEIVEYLVVRSVPGNGVGGYDNNMQDLAANLVGTVVSIATARAARLRVVGTPPSRGWINPGWARAASAIEIGVVAALVSVALWVLPAVMPPFAFAVLDVGLIAFGVLYTAWISPVLLHGDRLNERGLGTRREWFIRRDNLRVALRAFAVLALVATIALLLLAEWHNPGWLGRASWKAWALRLLFYAFSASIQALVFVGFLLVRLRHALVGSFGVGNLRFSDRAIVATTASLIFAVMHAPDPSVVALTAIFGFATAWISLARPNVFAAACCHALLGLLVHRALEIPLRVGYFYSHPGTYVFREAFPWVRRIVEGYY